MTDNEDFEKFYLSGKLLNTPNKDFDLSKNDAGLYTFTRTEELFRTWKAAAKPRPFSHDNFAHPTFMLGPDTPPEIMLELESDWEDTVITYSTYDKDNEDFPITAKWLSERYNIYKCTLFKCYETPTYIQIESDYKEKMNSE